VFANRKFTPVLLLALLHAAPGMAQGARPDSAAPSACWRFAFGTWSPALDWAEAGQTSDTATQAARTKAARDRAYAGDTRGVEAKAMTVERTPRGWLIMLYPDWWPAGVKLVLDSAYASGREFAGTAEAFAADAGRPTPKTRARGQQYACTSEI
jgi:hypothetical protein